MKISIETRPYNTRREGRPWIATVTFNDKGEADMAFGQWVGRDGEEGRLLVDAEVGQIVATGQKDFRVPKNSAAQYHEVAADGTLSPLASKVAAFDAWLARKPLPSAHGVKLINVDTDALIDELRRRGVTSL